MLAASVQKLEKKHGKYFLDTEDQLRGMRQDNFDYRRSHRDLSERLILLEKVLKTSRDHPPPRRGRSDPRTERPSLTGSAADRLASHDHAAVSNMALSAPSAAQLSLSSSSLN